MALANGPIIIDGFVHPAATDHQWKETIALLLNVGGAVAAIAAFVEARRGGAVAVPFSGPLGEAAAALMVGAVLGSAVVSFAAYNEVQASPGAGVANGVSAAPTQTPTQLTALASQFKDKNLELRAGSGTIYVVNRGSAPHTFDIDLGGRHYSYPIPANSTVGVVLNLAAGRYTYYCALPGHRASGMEGTLTVSSS